MNTINLREYDKEAGSVERKALARKEQKALAIKRAYIVEGITDSELKALVSLTPLAWCKGMEYKESILERVLSLTYVHASTYAKPLEHAYKSILWTIKHTRARMAARSISFVDALNFVEKREDARYSASNMSTLLESLNLDIRIQRESDFIGLTGEQARRRERFEKGLAARRAALLDDIEQKESAYNPEHAIDAEYTAREYVAKVYAPLREDAKIRIHAIARIVARNKEYLSVPSVNLFFNRLYNRAMLDTRIADETRGLTQGDFTYLLLKYVKDLPKASSKAKGLYVPPDRKEAKKASAIIGTVLQADIERRK